MHRPALRDLRAKLLKLRERVGRQSDVRPIVFELEFRRERIEILIRLRATTAMQICGVDNGV